MSINAIANRGKLIDAECYLHGAAAGPVSIGARGTTGVTGSGYGRGPTMNGDAIIFDTGGGFMEGAIVLDMATAATLATESTYTIHLQLSDDSGMGTTIVDRPILTVGEAAAVGITRWAAHRSTNAIFNYGNNRQRFIIPITNDFGGTCYRYLRLFHEFRKFTAASVDMGLQYSSWLSVMP